MKKITLDLSLSLNESGVNGISRRDLASLHKQLSASNKLFSSFATKPAFLKILNQKKEIAEVKKLALNIRKNFKSLIVIGIGGSDLGARAGIQALTKSDSFPVYFCGDTTDPAPLNELIRTVDLKTAAINVISKSGETIETLSAFLILKDALKKKVGARYAKHIFATTSPSQGLLSTMAAAEGFTLVPHMPVGGRFSVLSSVGFLPMAVAGINVGRILEGGIAATRAIRSGDPLNNAPFAYAAVNYLAARKRKINMIVLMPYAYKMQEFARWFRQLWAESLGKNGIGQTPIAALGPTDQHSQLQLFQDGPTDKIITFIGLSHGEHLRIPKQVPAGSEYLSGLDLGVIVKEEMKATAHALATHRKPSNTVTLPELNEQALGQLFMFFELATAYSAELASIDAYDQPGVELSKKYLHGALGKSAHRKDHTDRMQWEKKVKRLIIS